MARPRPLPPRSPRVGGGPPEAIEGVGPLVGVEAGAVIGDVHLHRLGARPRDDREADRWSRPARPRVRSPPGCRGPGRGGPVSPGPGGESGRTRGRSRARRRRAAHAVHRSSITSASRIGGGGAAPAARSARARASRPSTRRDRRCTSLRAASRSSDGVDPVVGLQHLEAETECGQRSAQLVGGVGDELLLGRDELLEPQRGRVEGLGEGADLGGTLGLFGARLEVAVADAGGRVAQLGRADG